MQKLITIVDEKFYGRLKSRGLTTRQEFLFDTLLKNEVGISSYQQAPISNYQDVFLEVGFGGGEHIAQMAITHQDSLFIGCEPFVNGVASLLIKIDESKIKNIRIYQGDARQLIKEIPNESLSGAFLLFPDPWPKRKHIKRRFLQDKTINDVYERLKPGGTWRIASDHNEYRRWIMKLFNQEKFQKIFSSQTFDRSNRPDAGFWPITRYEKKATDEVLYAIYTKKHL